MIGTAARWVGISVAGGRVFAALGLVAVFAALGGIYWDVTWHATIGRESFWIPPHKFVYSGVSLLLVAALGGFFGAWRGAGSFRSALAGGVGLGFAVAALGPTVQVAAAPIDDTWHRMYGLDVTVWSPPHLMGIAGGLVGIYGLLAALGASGLSLRAPEAGPLWRGVSAAEAVALGLFGAALSLSMFALGELDFHVEGRDALFYPLLAGALAAVPLMGAARYFGRPGAATAAALVYVVFRSSMLLVVWGMGSVEHLTPPVMVLAPALAIDLVLLRAGRSYGGGRVLAAALLAGPALLAGEWGVRALLGIGGWEPLEVLASLAVVTLGVAAGAMAGDRLGTLLRPEGEPVAQRLGHAIDQGPTTPTLATPPGATPVRRNP